MKKLICVILLLVISMSFASCKKEENGNTVLNVYASIDYKSVLTHSPNDKQANLMKWVKETFESENKGVTVNYQVKGWGDALNSAMLKDLNTSGKNAPDIFIGEEYVRNFISLGTFAEIKLDESIESDIIPAVKDYISKDGKIYAAPLYTGTYGISINTKVLRVVGVLDKNNEVTQNFKDALKATVGNSAYQQVDDIDDVNPLCPETWEDLLLICQYIKNYFDENNQVNNGAMVLSNIKGDSRWKTLAWLRTAGADYADKDGKPDVYGENAVKAYEMIRSLSQTASSYTGIVNATGGTQAMYSAFFGGKAAYIIEGAELLARSYQYPSFNDADLYTAELPCYEFNVTEKKGNALVGTVYYSINKNKPENYEIQNKFINFLMSEKTMYEFYEKDMRIPTRTSVLRSEKISEGGEMYNARLQPFFKAVLSDEYSFSGGLVGFSNNAALVWEKWESYIGKVYGGSGQISSMLEKLQSEMLSVYNRK